MDPKGSNYFGFLNFHWKQFWLIVFLASCCVVLTGCPHNDYTVELKPTGNAVERALTFYRADGMDSNGIPNYLEFSTNELASISRLYPANAVKSDGKRFVATGIFSGELPKDVGGAGSYRNLTTSLGEAGFYLERFRGNDDLVGRTAKQYAAADKITDLIIGWAHAEFGREHGWKNLRTFLDEDFRHDLKNTGQYFQLNAAVTLFTTNAPKDEFTARFVQYLREHGYFKLSDAPTLHLIGQDEGSDPILLRSLQQLVTEKIGVPANEPLPKSFGVFNDSASFKQSWERYLAKTDLYRTQVKDWERKKKTDTKLEQPKPADAMNGLIAEWLGVSGDGETDHLTVKLALDRTPNHSNGKWQDGKVIWGTDMDPNRALPVLCYASWSHPRSEFQTAHFGRIALDGDLLEQYCLWQNSLDRKIASEWEAFLSGLQPGSELKEKLESYKFSSQPDNGRNLLVKALATEAEKSSDAR
jgi:hypothetical protein